MRKFALFAALALAGTVFATSASASKPPSHLVTICHATPPDTAADGYVEITVDVASVGFVQSGHADQHDADIIPAYTFDGFSFPGKNWDSDGQAILNNGCVLPEGVEPPVSPPVPQSVLVCRDGQEITLTIPPDALEDDDVPGECPDVTTTTQPAPPVIVQAAPPIVIVAAPNTTG